MSNVFFIGDLHLGHRGILRHSAGHRFGASTIEEHDAKLIELWNSRVKPCDTVYMMGDICWSSEYLPMLNQLVGKKVLVRGNHDWMAKAQDWMPYVTDILGVAVYKNYWLSHCPIHPAELWCKRNIHGHVHTKSIRLENGELDHRYINVSVEALGGVPISFNEIESGHYDKIRKC